MQTTGEESTETPTEPESAERHAAPPSKGGNHPPGDRGHRGQGAASKPHAGSGSKPGTSASPRPEGSAPNTHTTSESGGGSSPVVPILIAMVVLAAVSIGVVLYRARKQDSGPESGTT
jgi:cobalamin biosynthesis Mg chelatase CobN